MHNPRRALCAHNFEFVSWSETAWLSSCSARDARLLNSPSDTASGDAYAVLALSVASIKITLGSTASITPMVTAQRTIKQPSAARAQLEHIFHMTAYIKD
jgi:hypothetical protein